MTPVARPDFWAKTHTGVLHGLLATEPHFRTTARPLFLLTIRSELHRRGANITPPVDLDLAQEWGEGGVPCLDRCPECKSAQG